MKKIKIFLLFCSMFVTSINLLANDWEFGSEGGHIVPMNMSNIAIKSEKLHFKLENTKTKDGITNHEMIVTVKFVLSTSATEIRLPFALEKTLAVSSLKVCVVGIVATGESLTALTVILIVSLSVKLPSVV